MLVCDSCVGHFYDVIVYLENHSCLDASFDGRHPPLYFLNNCTDCPFITNIALGRESCHARGRAFVKEGICSRAFCTLPTKENEISGPIGDHPFGYASTKTTQAPGNEVCCGLDAGRLFKSKETRLG